MRRSEVLAAEAVSCLNKALILLKDVWEQIGIPEPQRLERTRTVKKHIQGLLEMMIVEEKSLKLRLEKSVESSRAEIQRLTLELDTPPPQEEAQTLLQAEEELRGALEELHREKTRRLEMLQNLLQEEQELATILGTPRLNIDQTRPPSARQLDELQQHLANQREEQAQRQLHFQTLREHILVLFSDLDLSPDSDLEKHLVLEKHLPHSDLSLQKLDSLELRRIQLEQQRRDLQDESRLILDQIQTLWNRLQIPPNQRDAFTQTLPQRVRPRVQRLLLEAEHLEQMKLSELRSVSDRVRAEISEFWDKCFCSEEQRLGLSVFYTDEVSEWVLDALEAELQRLKQFYEDHRPIMEAVQKWMDEWELFLELERKASDPSRFTNRGGNLLKEERQRSELSKSLPKLERVLKEQISLWEQTQQSPFLVKGLDFLQFVELQWDILQQQKEQEKNLRHLKKARETEQDMMYGTTVRTPTKRRFIGTSSSSSPRGAPSRGTRRTPSPSCSIQTSRTNRTRRTPLGGCSLFTNSSLRSVTGQVSRSPGPRPPGPHPPQGPSVRTKAPQPRGPALTQDQVWTQEQKENRPQAPPETQSPGSVASTYSQFLRDLSESNAKVLNSTDL